jgi:dimeric dUTPase (all-alpha-NTP-PPase superfamily)
MILKLDKDFIAVGKLTNLEQDAIKKSIHLKNTVRCTDVKEDKPQEMTWKILD